MVTAIFEFNEQRGDYQVIIEGWQQLQDTRVKLEPDHYHSYLAACIFLGKDEEAYDAIAQMKRAGLTNSQTLHVCQSACIRAQRWAAYDEFEKRLSEVKRDDVALSLRLSALEKQNNWSEFTKVVTELERYTPAILNVVIPAVIRQGKPDEAKKVYNNAKSRGWDVDSMTFRRCLQACQEIRNWPLFDEWEKEMEAVIGLKNSKAPLSNQLTALVQQRKWDAAMELFDNLSFPNLHDYAMIIVAAIRQRNMKLAERYYTQLKSDGLLPESYVFSRCLDTCCSEDAWKEWDMWYDRAKRRGIYDSYILSSQLYRHQRREEYDQVRKVYEEAKAKGVHPNSFGLCSVALAACKYSQYRSGEASEARKIYDESKKQRIPVHSSFFNRLLAFFIRDRNFDAFTEWYDLMLADGISPTVHTHALAMEAKERTGRPAVELLKVWEKIRDVTKTPPLYAYTSLIIAFLKEGQNDAVEELWEDLVRSGNEVDCIFFNRVMLLAVTMKHWKTFEAWESKMLEADIPPNDATFAIRERGYKTRKMMDDWSKVREERQRWYEAHGRFRKGGEEAEEKRNGREHRPY